jgi:hypothetical protein
MYCCLVAVLGIHLREIDKLILPNLDPSGGQPNQRHYSNPPAASKDEKQSFCQLLLLSSDWWMVSGKVSLES